MLKKEEKTWDFLSVSTGYDDLARYDFVPSLDHLVYHYCFKRWVYERECCFPEGLLFRQPATSYPLVLQTSIMGSSYNDSSTVAFIGARQIVQNAQTTLKRETSKEEQNNA